MEVDGEDRVWLLVRGGRVDQLVEEFGVDYADEQGWTLAHIAASVGAVQVVAWFVESGGDLDAADEDGDRPLHVAVGEGNSEIVYLLLESGADPNVRNNEGATALHAACDMGISVDMVSMLVQAGASLGTPDKDGDTPIHLAASQANHVILNGLLAQQEAAHFLLLENANGATVLHRAVQSGYVTNVECVLRYSMHILADLLHKPDRDGDTALHIAAMFGYSDIVGLLLRVNASPIIRNGRGQKPSDCCSTDSILDVLWEAETKYPED